MEEEANILSFKIYIQGSGMLEPIDYDMYYYEIVEGRIFSPGGSAPVLEYKRLLNTGDELQYMVSVDTEKYKTIDEYAVALKTGLIDLIKERKVEVVGIMTEGNSEAIVVKATYTSKITADMILKAQESYAKKKKLKTRIERAKKDGDDERAKILEAELQNLIFEQSGSSAEAGLSKSVLQKAEEEGSQRQEVSLTQSQLAAESELKSKILEPEDKEEVQEEKPQAKPEQPVVIPPVFPVTLEKSSTTLSKESSKETSMVQSILNTILGGKTSTSSKESNTKEKSSSSKNVLQSQVVQAMIASVPSLLQRELEKQASSVISTVSNAEKTVNEIVSKVIPAGGLSGMMENILKEGSNFVSETKRSESQDAILTTISDSISVLQKSITDITKQISDRRSEIDSILNISSKSDERMKEVLERSDSSNVAVDNTSSSERMLSERLSNAQNTETLSNSIETKLFQAIEKSKLFSEMQGKIVDIESAAPAVANMTDVISNLGNTIKTAITNTSASDTKNVEVSAPSSTRTMTTKSETNVGGTSSTIGDITDQSMQNIASSVMPSMPTVVSLSQSTIDSLASAIIKNMSITPFLNSGR